jgi:hypothetical protein
MEIFMFTACPKQLINNVLVDVQCTNQSVLQPLVDELRHDHVVACIGPVLKGLPELVVVWQAHVVVLQPVESVHHMKAAGVHS